MARLLLPLFLCIVWVASVIDVFCSNGIKYSFVAFCSPLVVRWRNSNWSFLNDPGTSGAFYTLCFLPLRANCLNYRCFLFSTKDWLFNLKDSFVLKEGILLKAIEKALFSIYSNENAVYLSICQCFVFCNTGAPSFPRAPQDPHDLSNNTTPDKASPGQQEATSADYIETNPVPS